MADKVTLQLAIQALDSGDAKHAQHLLAGMLKADPRDVRAWVLMAEAQTDPKRRQECLDRALQIDPHNEIARLLMAPEPTDENAWKHEKERKQPQSEIADQRFAPGLLQNRERSFNRVDGPNIFDNQDRHDEKRDDSPCGAEDGADKGAGLFVDIFDSLEQNADRRGDKGPSCDLRKPAGRRAESITQRWLAAVEPFQRTTHECRVEEHDEEVIDEVKRE